MIAIKFYNAYIRNVWNVFCLLKKSIFNNIPKEYFHASKKFRLLRYIYILLVTTNSFKTIHKTNLKVMLINQRRKVFEFFICNVREKFGFCYKKINVACR